MTIQVLLIEDNSLSQSESLLASLEAQGYQVSLVHTPETAVEKLRILWPNLVIYNHTPSLNLSHFQAGIDKIDLSIPHVVVADKQSVSAGVSADTIVVAPGKPQQLTQGIQKATSNQKNRFLRFSHLVVDCHKQQVLRDDNSYALTPKEFKLLLLLINNHDEVLSRKEIMHQVWETDYLGDTRTLDVHIRWLREKIEVNPSRPRRLLTVRGVGYRFVTEPEQDEG